MTLPPFIQQNVPLAAATTFGIGGVARWLAEPATLEELRESLQRAAELSTQVKILGGGSNLLIADSGVDAMVIRLAKDSVFGTLGNHENNVLEWRVGAAVGLPLLVRETARQGICGIEHLAGIPGRVGGAAVMNAGSAESGLGTFIVQATVIDRSGTVKTLSTEDLSFGYRSSNFGAGIISELLLRFPASDQPELVQQRVCAYSEKKRNSQPIASRSAGCVFKNPPGQSAGSLLDQAGCKDMREGDAVVSSLHANYILNSGGANAEAVAVLAKRMREAVTKRFGIVLESEIRLWGAAPSFRYLRKDITNAID